MECFFQILAKQFQLFVDNIWASNIFLSCSRICLNLAKVHKTKAAEIKTAFFTNFKLSY
jgi:hypothetical protein